VNYLPLLAPAHSLGVEPPASTTRFANTEVSIGNAVSVCVDEAQSATSASSSSVRTRVIINVTGFPSETAHAVQ